MISVLPVAKRTNYALTDVREVAESCRCSQSVFGHYWETTDNKVSGKALRGIHWQSLYSSIPVPRRVREGRLNVHATLPTRLKCSPALRNWKKKM